MIDKLQKSKGCSHDPNHEVDRLLADGQILSRDEQDRSLLYSRKAIMAKPTDALMSWEKIPETPQARKKMKAWVYVVDANRQPACFRSVP
jgi:hypothetical protein